MNTASQPGQPTDLGLSALRQQIKNLKKSIKRDEDELKKIRGFPATIRLRWVWCGKACAGCPHGPYYYAYRKNNKKLECIYIGKDSEFAQECQAAQQLVKQLRRKQVLLRRLELRLRRLQRRKAA